MTYELSASRRIDAAPEAVHALVSDVTRTGEWSVQTHRAAWDGPERGVGATFTGHNRTAERVWQTVSEVVVDEPGREFAWAVGPGRALWGFRMEADGEGTLLTHYTQVSSSVESYFAQKYGAEAQRELGIRHQAAQSGIPRTLAAIAAILEEDRGGETAAD